MQLQENAYIDANPVIILSPREVVLAKRKTPVIAGGLWHLPGGRVLTNETLTNTLQRVAFIKTNLEIDLFTSTLKTSLVGLYDNPTRDPREHIIGLAFLCRVIAGTMTPGYNVQKVQSFTFEEVKDLEVAFDHRKMINDAHLLLKQIEPS